jgi:hypothetical protein
LKRKNKFLLSISILIVASIACNASLPQVEPTALPTPIQQPTAALSTGSSTIPLSEAGVPRLAVDQAKAAFDAGQAVIVDVRSADAYAAGHAEGAINIPLGNFEIDIAKIPLEKDQWIITYCT